MASENLQNVFICKNKQFFFFIKCLIYILKCWYKKLWSIKALLFRNMKDFENDKLELVKFISQFFSPNFKSLFIYTELDNRLKHYKTCFQGNWAFPPGFNFIIPISLQPIVIDFWFFKLRILINQSKFEISLGYAMRL